MDRLDRLEPLRRKTHTWAQGNLEVLRDSDPNVPQLQTDRAADNWRPLLAIADQVGGIWPDRARKAAVLLSGRKDEDEDAAVLLLADVQRVFMERGTTSCLRKT